MQGSLKENSRIALALSTGVLGALAFSGDAAWPLGLSAWVPLLVAIDRVPPRAAFWLGWVAGVVMTSLGYAFLAPTLVRESGFAPGTCLLIFVALGAYQGLRAGLLALLLARATERGWPRAAASIAFAASELLVPLPFPFHFGASVEGATRLVQIADLAGPIAVGMVVFATNLGLAELWMSLSRGMARRRRTAAWLLACPLAAALYGSVRVEQVDRAIARAEPLSVGVVHVGAGLRPHAPDPSFLVRETRSLGESGAELVVWGEAALPGALPAEDLAGVLRAAVTGRVGVPTIVGALVAEDDRAEPRIFNAAIASDARGAQTGRYDKRHLAPFGEELPLGDHFPALYALSPRSGHVTAGDVEAPMRFRGHAIATTICYEDLLPRYVADLVRETDAEVLLNVGSDGWFTGTDEPALHLALARSRAVEHRRFLVRAVDAGASGIVDPVGRVILSLPRDRDGGAIGEVRWLQMHTIYDGIGDTPWWFATGLVLFFASVRRDRAAGLAARALRGVRRPRGRPVRSSAPS